MISISSSLRCFIFAWSISIILLFSILPTCPIAAQTSTTSQVFSTSSSTKSSNESTILVTGNFTTYQETFASESTTTVSPDYNDSTNTSTNSTNTTTTQTISQEIVRNLYIETVMAIAAAIAVPLLFMFQLVVRSGVRIFRMREVPKKSVLVAAEAEFRNPVELFLEWKMMAASNDTENKKDEVTTNLNENFANNNDDDDEGESSSSGSSNDTEDEDEEEAEEEKRKQKNKKNNKKRKHNQKIYQRDDDDDEEENSDAEENGKSKRSKNNASRNGTVINMSRNENSDEEMTEVNKNNNNPKNKKNKKSRSRSNNNTDKKRALKRGNKASSSVGATVGSSAKKDQKATTNSTFPASSSTTAATAAGSSSNKSYYHLFMSLYNSYFFSTPSQLAYMFTASKEKGSLVNFSDSPSVPLLKLMLENSETNNNSRHQFSLEALGTASEAYLRLSSSRKKSLYHGRRRNQRSYNNNNHSSWNQKAKQDDDEDNNDDGGDDDDEETRKQRRQNRQTGSGSCSRCLSAMFSLDYWLWCCCGQDASKMPISAIVNAARRNCFIVTRNGYSQQVARIHSQWNRQRDEFDFVFSVWNSILLKRSRMRVVKNVISSSTRLSEDDESSGRVDNFQKSSTARKYNNNNDDDDDEEEGIQGENSNGDGQFANMNQRQNQKQFMPTISTMSNNISQHLQRLRNLQQQQETDHNIRKNALKSFFCSTTLRTDAFLAFATTVEAKKKQQEREEKIRLKKEQDEKERTDMLTSIAAAAAAATEVHKNKIGRRRNQLMAVPSNNNVTKNVNQQENDQSNHQNNESGDKNSLVGVATNDSKFFSIGTKLLFSSSKENSGSINETNERNDNATFQTLCREITAMQLTLTKCPMMSSSISSNQKNNKVEGAGSLRLSAYDVVDENVFGNDADDERKGISTTSSNSNNLTKRLKKSSKRLLQNSNSSSASSSLLLFSLPFRLCNNPSTSWMFVRDGSTSKKNEDDDDDDEIQGKDADEQEQNGKSNIDSSTPLLLGSQRQCYQGESGSVLAVTDEVLARRSILARFL